MTTCSVENCGEPPSEVFEVAGVAYLACQEHSLALRAGEHASFAPESKQITLGSDALPFLIDISETIERGNPNTLVTLKLGRNGLADENITFQVSDEMRARIRDQ